MYWDTTPPPDSLKAMVDEAAAIVVGRFEGQSRLVETVIDPKATILSTVYGFHILEVVKVDPLVAVGSVLNLELPGGR
jgi:hypothetical protein